MLAFKGKAQRMFGHELANNSPNKIFLSIAPASSPLQKQWTKPEILNTGRPDKPAKPAKPVAERFHNFDGRIISLAYHKQTAAVPMTQPIATESQGMVKQIFSRPMRFSISLGNTMVSVSKDQITIRINFLQPVRLNAMFKP